ncbi:restriction endonuclease subunit S [Escherichia coli]|uniref:restriction endonuclease subunit S n=1 Tax=Escherichia coli TaxID=562 RepID=UPI000BE20327|nr:restriction endonuclease subunit S [Escherichia coli]EEV6180908.1 restriction endonuclease subunit S [Escherichia coli]EEW1006202.1 restriction endonuclease subunit S [Escherichia coli]EFC3277223.1 restriction endonuclease subunit S [Escherichia coli]EFD4933780.1 restriction endonuclease subunit S [Escherichia coli]EFH9091134.1 restriction endonuclease subunit S [Escherichia coli]
MSGLSYLEKLLDGAEVEWRTLDSVGQFLRGKRFVKSDLISEGVPCIHYGEMYTHYGISAEETKSFLDEGVAEKLRVANHGDVIIVAAGETIEDIGNGTAWLGKNDVVFHDACFSFKSELNSKYVSYFLRTNLFKEQIKRGVSSGKISSINAKGLGMAEIPIPCPNNPEKSLAIQSEIVRILDKFTALTAELTAELTMRKKQYNYYRDLLLSFEEGEVEWKTLEEVLVDKFWIMPATPKFDDNGEIPYVTSKNISGGNIDFERVKHISRDDFLSISKNRPILKGDFLISMIGTIGEIARVKCLDPDFYGQNMYLIRLNEELLHPRYFLHFFDSPRMKFYFKSVKNNSGQGYLKANNIDGLSIPLPSIDEQQKIAFILDKFDTLTNPINEGLPREIELRQKQYEYYRDLLFSFPKPETVSN